jgi:nucleoside-diphosphate-sugar epimerase
MGSDALTAAGEALKRRIKERVGMSVEIAAHGSGGVPRSQGKAVRIVDNRQRPEAMPRGLARDHEQKRDALRRGAAAHFAAQGYDRASMASVARPAASPRH